MAYTTLAAIADPTKLFAIDLISGSVFNRTKMTIGAEGVAVDVSATNPLPVAAVADTSAAGTIAMSATTNAVTLTLAGQAGVGVEVSGTWTGALIFEAQVGAAGSWGTVFASPLSGGLRSSTITANAVMELIGAGVTAVRVRCSVIGTGTASVLIVGTAAQRIIRVWSTDPANLVTLAASDPRIGDGLGAALTPLYAPIAATASGDNLVVAGVAGKRIRAVSYDFIAAAAVSAKFRSNTTDITGLQSIAATGGKVNGFTPAGWLQTAVGEALNLNLSAAVQVGGALTYVLV